MNTLTTSTSLRSNGLRLLVALVLVGGAIAPRLSAQTAYKVAGKQNVMTLYGTSTMHDWTMAAHSFACDAVFNVTADNELTGLQSLNLTLPIHNLKSEHEGMDNNAYETLKGDKFKGITFRCTSGKVTSTGAHKCTVAALGNLTIAGVTKQITINANAVVNADGSVSASGTVPIKLSDFGIERPSFMLGSMKVGDAMTLNFAVMFAK